MSASRGWGCALVLLLLPVAGCDCRGSKAERAIEGGNGGASTSSASVSDATRSSPPSPFTLVARGAFSLRRAATGPAYATAGRFVFALDPKGTLTPVRPLVAELNINLIGTIGTSPEGVTYIEAVLFGDATSSAITLGVAGSAMYHVANGERFTGFFPWKERSLLTLRSEAASQEIGTPTLFHKARFEVLGGPKSMRVPKIPDTFVHGDQFAAYPDGRVLLVAADRPKDNPMQVDPAFILDFGTGADAPPKRIDLPRTELGETFVSAGRSLAELIVYEKERPHEKERSTAKPRLFRLEGDAFVSIPLDLPLPIQTLSRGDDGSLWLTTGYYGDGYVRGGLYRVTITGTHAESVRVQVPDLEPFEVLALSADDVWLTASKGGTASELELLHTQAPVKAENVLVVDYPTLEREAWAEVVPPAYTPSCQSPLLVLGPASDLDDTRVLAASRALDFPADAAVRGRLGGEQLWAIEDMRLELEGSRYKTPNAALAAWKKQLPSAKLVCAGIRVDKTLQLRSR